MKKIKLGTILTLFALTLFIFSCGESGHSHDAEGGHAEETSQTDENTEADADAEIDLNSKEYASAFICPMHCKGSGSDVAGTCPACGMDYVANESTPASDADAGHDHDDHEGHNH